MEPKGIPRLIYRLQRLAPRVPVVGSAMRRVLARRGELSISEAKFLGELASACKPGEAIIEIGVLFGSSTKVLAMFKPPQCPLYAVDHFKWNPYGFNRDEHYRITTAILEDAVANHNVQLVRSGKSDFYKSYDGPTPALAFIDANHSYESTLEDIRWARQIGARTIAGHDYCAEWPGVMQAVDECGEVSQLVGTLFVLKDDR